MQRITLCLAFALVAAVLPALAGAQTRTPAEKQCMDTVQGKVAWDYKQNATAWDEGNLLNLCGGTVNAPATVACFQSELKKDNRWQTAIAACKPRPVVAASSTDSRSAAPAVAVAQTRTAAEKQCMDAVQGKVAWNYKQNATAWDEGNLLNLCGGTVNAPATVACFQSELKKDNRWQTAIAACKPRPVVAASSTDSRSAAPSATKDPYESTIALMRGVTLTRNTGMLPSYAIPESSQNLNLGDCFKTCFNNRDCLAFTHDKQQNICRLTSTPRSKLELFSGQHVNYFEMANRTPAAVATKDPYESTIALMRGVTLTRNTGMLPSYAIPESSQNLNLGDCFKACSNNRDCLAFTHDKQQNVCRLTSTPRSKLELFSGQHVNYFEMTNRAPAAVATKDPYESTIALMRGVTLTRNTGMLPGDAIPDSSQNLNLGDCFAACFHNRACLAFVHDKERNLCRLTSTPRSNLELFSAPQVNYFQMTNRAPAP